MVYEDYTVLALKRLSSDSLQVLAVYLLPTLLRIVIPATYKGTKIVTYS